MSTQTPTYITREQLYALMATQSCTIVAANRRLVRDCHWAYGAAQQARGLSVWNTPAVATLGDYLQALWQRQLLGPQAAAWPQPNRILNTLELRRLWQQVITQHDAERGLLRISETARLAAEAFELECSFQLPSSPLASEEVQRYQKWKKSFSDFILKKHWLTPAQWQQQMLNGLQQSNLLSSDFVLLGFDDEPPLLRQFCALVQAQGGQLFSVVSSAETAEESRCAPANTEQERIRAVRWAMTRASAGQRVAIVVPDLSAQRIAMERVLLRLVHPASARSFTPLNKGQFNMSAGASLSEQAMVQHALLFLRMMSPQRDWSLLDLSVLLHSPYIGDFERDGATRARLDAKWRDIANESLRVSKALQQFEQYGLSQLHQHCIAARDQVKAWSSRLLPSQWAENFQQLLHCLNWPGTRNLDSVAWQCRAAFDEALIACAQLDDVTGAIDSLDALKLLKQICHDAVFQAQANAQAPIQVLGMLEVSGQYFDAIWVLNVSDEQLPAAAKPNPFIALPLQRQFALPRSSVEHEWQYVQRWQHSLRRSCKTLIWSCAELDGEQSLRASALISAIALSPIDEITPPESSTIAAPLDIIWQETAVPLALDQPFVGGIEALRLQARNPLAAFAQFRLNANPVATITPFTTPRLHGLLLHACLQHFWTAHHDQHTLLAMNEANLNQAIADCIAAAFISVEQKEGQTLPPVWRALEEQLLSRLLQEWLQLEMQRPAFQVQACEEKLSWQFKQWQMQTRVDRIDVDASGKLLVIDYKSGSAPSPQQWYLSPLLEPQLPLYALILGDKVNAISYAQLKRGEMKWSGRANDAGWGNAIKVDEAWPSLREQWQHNIENLAEQFLQGVADNTYARWADLSNLNVRPFLRAPAIAHDDEMEDLV